MPEIANRDKPRISVCIANYNGIDVIGPCVESVMNQSVECEYEILVHDDASTDDSVGFIKSNYPQVNLITSDQNVGYCVSNNRMADRASGEYLLFLNNDAALFPDALQVLMDAVGDAECPGILGLPQYDMESGALLDRGSLLDPFFNPVPNKNPVQSDVGMIMGACLWVPRPLWEEIGGFPEWLHTLAEDMYLCLVARVYGYEVKVLNRSGYRHRVGHSLGGGKVKKGALSTTAGRRRMSERNKTFVMVVCLPTLMLGMLLPIHLLLLFLEGMLLSVVKLRNIWSDVYSYTFQSLWVERRRLRKERSKVQGRRNASFKKIASIFVWYPYKLKMLLYHGLPTIEE